MFGLFSQVQGWVKLKGATDGTKIGNTGDSLKALITASALPTGAATEAKLELVRLLLASIDGKDFATQTTLSALNSKDFATQATLASVLSSLGTLNAKDFATQATLASILANLNVLTTAPANNAQGLVVRQVPYELATYSVVAELITVGNNKSMLAIKNTGTSIVKIREIWIINDRTTAVTGVAGEFRAHRIASFSGGTALTPVSFDTQDSLPSGITCATNATVASETSLLRTGKWSTDEWGPGTQDVESSDHALQNTEPFWKQTPSGKPITIRQNQGMHIRFATNSTAGEFNIRLTFTTE